MKGHTKKKPDSPVGEAPFRSAWSPCLDLSSAKAHGEIGNKNLEKWWENPTGGC